MLVSEFTNLTGYIPTGEEFEEIEQLYYCFDGDKREFCKAWSKFNPEKAGSLWRMQKASEIRDKEINKCLAIVLRYVNNKKISSSMVLGLSDFREMFKSCDKKISRETILNLYSWRSVTCDWDCEKWAKYHNIYAFACQGY